MLIDELVWENVCDFCRRNSLYQYRQRMTNICSKIVLLNDQLRISFYIEEMELYLHIKVEFINLEKETVKTVSIDDRASDKIISLRKKWIRSWRKSVKKRFFVDMIEEYVRLIQKIIDEQNPMPCNKKV